MRKIRIIPLLLTVTTIVSIGLAVYFGASVQQLEKALNEQLAQNESMASQWELQGELRQIDSVLLLGKYGEAQDAYAVTRQNTNSLNDPDIELRLALAGELLRLENEKIWAYQQLSADSLPNPQSDIITHNTQAQKNLDSLSFALEKTRVQVKSLRKQLSDRSFGEYLTFTNSRGSQMHYVGQVKHGKANGYGVALLNTGSRYVGSWKNNRREGEGTYYWSDGQYYTGSFHNDKRQGEGTYYWPNGEKYVGHWKEDQRSGEGVFYDKDGNVLANGIWKDDKLAAVENTKRVRIDGK